MIVECVVCESKSDELSDADAKTLAASLKAAEKRGNAGFVICQLCLENYKREKLAN